MLGRFLLIFVHDITWPRARIHWPCQYEIHFFDFWLLCCWDDFRIDFWLIFGRFGGRKSSKNRPKIDQKSGEKSYAILDGSWRALGAILDGFWLQVGGQVGAKLAPKSEEMGYRDDVNKSSKIWSRGGTRLVREWSASKSGPGP